MRNDRRIRKARWSKQEASEQVADGTMDLPAGTAVYCLARRMVLDLKWRSPLGLHIVRSEICLGQQPTQQRAALIDAARIFRRTVQAERENARP